MDYDAWKLSSPWDDEPNLPEIYKAEKCEYYHENEELIDQFDTAYARMENKLSSEDLEEFAEDLADNLGLDYSENEALKRIADNEYENYLDAVENGYKGSYRGVSYRVHYRRSWIKKPKKNRR